ncbi:unnamed protein product, partial [Iphiclides podalirius]
MALNRYNIIESTGDQPGSIQETNPLFSPIYGKALFISSIPWRGNTVHSYRQDNPDSGGHKRGNNVANIERNNPAVRSSRSPPGCRQRREEDGNNNGGKRLLMTNLRFSFRYTSFSRILIISPILRGKRQSPASSNPTTSPTTPREGTAYGSRQPPDLHLNTPSYHTPNLLRIRYDNGDVCIEQSAAELRHTRRFRRRQ